jgi:hypothetical protein
MVGLPCAQHLLWAVGKQRVPPSVHLPGSTLDSNPELSAQVCRIMERVDGGPTETSTPWQP